MSRYLCIHGHFYQPPREHPGLEDIERQDSAAPYHDWNARITAECYAPMGEARILNDEGLICALVNNYARVSFNFGATLLTWMERSAPEAYRSLIAADGEARRLFSGHGSAIAQAYHHAIMPLCSARDKQTQTRWGMRDFEHRFLRRAEGMWLPECAADTASLEALAAEGVLFTILAPRQAKRVRPPGGAWKQVGDGVDPRRAYRISLPSGRSIAVFFYDGPVSQAVAFERLLNSGPRFTDRLLHALDDRATPQLAHIATDGETYGHHHRFGEMALAHALSLIDRRDDVSLTVYGEFLERHPPEWEAEIVEESSWSCAHGIERWRSDCGCRAADLPGWSQAWRGPLRHALEYLRDEVAQVFERELGRLLRDPWAARDDFIRVMLNNGDEVRAQFLQDHAIGELSLDDQRLVWTLLEQQRHSLYMFTSCGWFFDDLAGIETLQVIAYADRVLQLGEGTLASEVELGFLQRLEGARSNVSPQRTGRELLAREIRPRRVSLRKVALHTAIGRLLDDDHVDEPLRGYPVTRRDEQAWKSGRYATVSGRIDVRSERTAAVENLEYAAIHLGDHSVVGGVREAGDDDAFRQAVAPLHEATDRGDVHDALRALEAAFGAPWSLKDLFIDPQRRVVDRILAERVVEVDAALERIFADQRPLRRFLVSLGVPLPEPLKHAAAAAVQSVLRREFEGEVEQVTATLKLVEEAREEGIALREEELAFTLQNHLERHVIDLMSAPLDRARWAPILRMTSLAKRLPFTVDLGRVQNAGWRLLQELDKDSGRDPEEREAILAWCRELGIRIPK